MSRRSDDGHLVVQAAAAPEAGAFLSSLRLDGRTAIVTGASRGIGAEAAAALAELGATVVLSSRDQAACEAQASRINESHPGAAMAIAAHAGREDDLLRLARTTVATYGRVDILVNNAATNAHFGPLLEAELAAWDKTFAVNLRGPFILTQAVVELSMREHGGSIVNVASVGGLEPGSRLGVYNITKAALIHFTRQLGRELGPYGIRVNGVAPGLIKTRFAEALWSDDAVVDDLTSTSPLARVGECSEVAATIAFLASDATSYTTGQILTIDGGAGRIL